MGSYLPSTPAQQQQMLEAVGAISFTDLYSAVPTHLLAPQLDLPDGKGELEVQRTFQAMAAKNHVYGSIFRGAGAYNHYIPSLVKNVVGKETLLTAYTPYQAEISQGILQSIFEYQSMICALTGMEVSNASVYDGATAAAEAMAMCRERKRSKTLVSACVDPQVLQVMQTYSWAADAELAVIPEKDGRTDMDALAALLDDGTACVYIQQPNFYGQIEDAPALCEATHAGGAKLVMGVNPIAMALLQTPGECGADIAVGEGQPLGMPLAYGGPYLGFMATTTAMMRRLPGRIVGQTADAEGRRAFVLTLQAREQHIRREKAGSNICSNQALCAMTAAAYMATMGPEGMRDVARQCMDKAHYLAASLQQAGCRLKYEGPFFHEFVTLHPGGAQPLLARLAKQDILGGLPLDSESILWCATELNTKDEMDKLVAIAAQGS